LFVDKLNGVEIFGQSLFHFLIGAETVGMGSHAKGGESSGDCQHDDIKIKQT